MESLGRSARTTKPRCVARHAGHLIAQLDTLADNTQDPTTGGAGRRKRAGLLPAPHSLHTPPGEYTSRSWSIRRLACPAARARRAGAYPPRSEACRSSAADISATVEIEAGSPLSATITPEIAIAGYDLDSSQPYSPGGQGTMALYWRITGTPGADLDWHLTLRDAGHEWPLIQAVPPLGTQFPTSQ